MVVGRYELGNLIFMYDLKMYDVRFMYDLVLCTIYAVDNRQFLLIVNQSYLVNRQIVNFLIPSSVLPSQPLIR